MIKSILNLLFIFLASGTILLGQVSYHPDSTIIKKRIKGEGKVYTSNGHIISKYEVNRRLKSCDESAEEYERSMKRCDRDNYYGGVNVDVSIPSCHTRMGGYLGPRGCGVRSGGGGKSIPHCNGKAAIIVGVAFVAVGVVIVTPLICEAIIRHDHYKKAIRIYNEKMANQYG